MSYINAPSAGAILSYSRVGVLKDLAGGNYINIDVMSQVHGGITTKAIASRAMLAESPAGPFLVIHPLDVLKGRLENIYALSAKQDEHGMAQLRLAVSFGQWISDPLSLSLSRIRCPTLVLHGARDPVVPLQLAEEIHNAIPSGLSKLHVIESASHPVVEDASAESLSVLGEFLFGNRE